MNQVVRLSHGGKIAASACPHDCPSTCALEVEVLDERTIGRVRGAEDNTYTAGVICAKVARYAERVHHPERPTSRSCARAQQPGRLRRFPGTPRSIWWPRNSWPPSSKTARRRSGPTTTPAPTSWSCATAIGCATPRDIPASSRPSATTSPGPATPRGPKDRRPDPRDGEIGPDRHLGDQRRQHAGQRDDARDPRPQGARCQDRRRRRLHERDHGAGRSAGADPSGTDGALACAVMHCLFRDDKADWDYLERYIDVPHEPRSDVLARPAMASRITDCPAETIEAFARLLGERARAFFRLGYGFSRCATAPPTCTRQAAFRRSPAPGCTRGEGHSSTTARSITGTRP